MGVTDLQQHVNARSMLREAVRGEEVLEAVTFCKPLVT